MSDQKVRLNWDGDGRPCIVVGEQNFPVANLAESYFQELADGYEHTFEAAFMTRAIEALRVEAYKLECRRDRELSFFTSEDHGYYRNRLMFGEKE